MKLNLELEPDALEHLIIWSKKELKTIKKILDLFDDMTKNPYIGKGKPEPLKYDLTGWWSRRIDNSNRIVYKLSDSGEKIIVRACKYHYKQ